MAWSCIPDMRSCLKETIEVHQEVTYHVHDCLRDKFSSLDHNREMFQPAPDSLSSTIQNIFYPGFIFYSHLTLLHVGSCVANTQ